MASLSTSDRGRQAGNHVHFTKCAPSCIVAEDDMPDQELRFEDCYFIRDGDTVTLGNSRIERVWWRMQNGLRTRHFIDKLTGRDWFTGMGWEWEVTTEYSSLPARRDTALDSIEAE